MGHVGRNDSGFGDQLLGSVAVAAGEDDVARVVLAEAKDCRFADSSGAC